MLRPRCYAWASSCGEWGHYLSCHVRASYYCDFSCHGAQGLGHVGSVVAAHRCQRAGSVVVAHGLRCPKAHGIFLPWPKIELVSLALQGVSWNIKEAKTRDYSLSFQKLNRPSSGCCTQGDTICMWQSRTTLCLHLREPKTQEGSAEKCWIWEHSLDEESGALRSMNGKQDKWNECQHKAEGQR